MATSDFDRLWEEVRALSHVERQELRDLLARLEIDSADSEEDFEARLIAAGAISGPTCERAAVVWQPVTVAGTPLSATLIEDRR